MLKLHQMGLLPDKAGNLYTPLVPFMEANPRFRDALHWYQELWVKPPEGPRQAI